MSFLVGTLFRTFTGRRVALADGHCERVEAFASELARCRLISGYDILACTDKNVEDFRVGADRLRFRCIRHDDLHFAVRRREAPSSEW